MNAQIGEVTFLPSGSNGPNMPTKLGASVTLQSQSTADIVGEL
jgi:hypothetical protein